MTAQKALRGTGTQLKRIHKSLTLRLDLVCLLPAIHLELLHKLEASETTRLASSSQVAPA